MSLRTARRSLRAFSGGRVVTCAKAALACLCVTTTALARPQEPPQYPDLVRNQTLNDYRTQVELALPVLDPLLLAPGAGPDWFAGVDVGVVTSAVGDSTALGQVFSNPPLLVARDLAESTVVKLDDSRDYVRYASSPRAFRWSTSPHVGVDPNTALGLVASAATTLGIPGPEQFSIVVDTIVGLRYEESTQTEGTEFHRERLVTIRRSVGGFPVYGSLVRGAVSNGGLISRLLVKWPRFVMAGGHSLRARQAVVDELAQRIMDAELGAVVELEVQLGYARAGDLYLPVARAAFDDPLGGVVAFVPVVDVPPDYDLDGVPDATDNCPDRANPDQSDLDLDGRGDDCDNCPGTSNPGQEDCNHDGVGDACVPDCNANGVPDDCDVATGTSTDLDGDGVPDECDASLFCFGDGSGTPCPCGNPGVAPRGCANGAEPMGALLAGEGDSSIAGGMILRGLGMVPNQPGLFFQGANALGAGFPFGDGLRCVGGQVVRLQILFAEPDGSAATTIDVAAKGGVAVGDTRRYQVWYRDPLASPCGFRFNLSNGLEIHWAP